MIVIDASMAGPMVLIDEDPISKAIAERLSGETIVVPANWQLECMSMLHVAEQRRRIDRGQRIGAARQLRALPVRVDRQTGERAWSDTSRLADEHSLTVYDAAYLELAIRSQAALATLDGDLRDAALASGVEVLTFK
ncbi:type II toxin-antitoxin system VapC family toxin [Sphingomonas sp.]|uniref:type II toxin-antitoxin system VapC family toxin n=1 Tax=Sphingomonas sp. TaxID=28214 RepID=UPI0035BBAEB1